MQNYTFYLSETPTYEGQFHGFGRILGDLGGLPLAVCWLAGLGWLTGLGWLAALAALGSSGELWGALESSGELWGALGRLAG